MIQRDEAAYDIGEWKAIQNLEINRLYACYYDAWRGMGENYCISYEFHRSEWSDVVKGHQGVIPAPSVYKNIFEVCDKSNRTLHDDTWVHS